MINIKTKEDVLNIAKKEKVIFIRLQFVDILGMPKNIVIPLNRLEEALNEGMPFDASSIAGYATIEESDKIARPDPVSFVILPDEIEKRKTAKLNCDIYEPNGKRFEGDCKYILEKVVNKAKNMGYIYNTGPECEFFLFKKDGNQSTLTPNDAAGYFDLSHRDLAEGVRADISIALDAFGIDTYTSHHEVSDGQHEINFKYADALTTADRVITLKYVTKVIAKKHELHASFMPKPLFGSNGSGMHTHLSLFNLKGKSAFYDPNDKNNLSKTARYFIGGLLKYVKEMTAILNPIVNSYKRLVPGYEAPTYISWANRNRSALIRIPTGRENKTRCELRSPDLSGNPYLQFAVMLAAGLNGIEEKVIPPNPVEKNIYALSEQEMRKYKIHHLPESLGHALSFLEESKLMKETLGNHIFENFLHVKKSEWNKYRTQVTPWEIDKYLQIL
ncbi:MAG: type I glutamate--ammonia ligase [Thermoplasmata archaeon M9B1D]|nr:MAG: type I glutamate--ammonia ligase [Thermoplasmata archaeon M9B1D]PNX51500.1 MAG: type I glutamate--ammonia ligase [Thermoplasmata archaeon M8B2D]